MSVNVLFAATQERWDQYHDVLRAALHDAGIDAHVTTEIAPETVDYIVYAPNSELQDFTPYSRAKAVLNLWAGVETVVGNETLHIPLCRMVDPALTQGMVEWVVGHILRLHLGMDTHINARPGTWEPEAPPLAFDTKVAILGLGALGSACGQALVGLGFEVAGWSRSRKDVIGVTCHAGSEGLMAALKDAQYCVLLLPDTAETDGIINADTLAMLPRGACLLNPGRGPLINDADLIAALDSGHLSHATLDAFREEPLPVAHPFWHHPDITVTPHIASETRASYAAKTLAENVRRGESGEPLLYQVDRNAGY